jgi:hypothetical protein
VNGVACSFGFQFNLRPIPAADLEHGYVRGHFDGGVVEAPEPEWWPEA